MRAVTHMHFHSRSGDHFLDMRNCPREPRFFCERLTSNLNEKRNWFWYVVSYPSVVGSPGQSTTKDGYQTRFSSFVFFFTIPALFLNVSFGACPSFRWVKWSRWSPDADRMSHALFPFSTFRHSQLLPAHVQEFWMSENCNGLEWDSRVLSFSTLYLCWMHALMLRLCKDYVLKFVGLLVKQTILRD